MEAQAHTSCNRRAGCYMRATAPPLVPLPRLLDCGTSTVTRGTPAYDPTVPARRDGQYGQKWAGSNGGGRRAEAAVSHGVKTARPCSVPRTARARATAAPRTTRPVALTLQRDRRRLWQEKRVTLRLRHNDRVKKGAPRHLDFVFFPFFLFLSLTTGTGKGGYPERDPSP
jgi:hypothetical protein